MLYNPTSQRFITAFEGTRAFPQLIHELVTSIAIPYTLHDIPDSHILDYFGTYYTGDLRSQFLDSLQNAISQYPDSLFIFTGHSLGGALATLAGQDAILSGIVNKEDAVLYTYGSPRVGDFNYASNVDTLFSGIYRVVHYEDIVPHVPPCSLLDTSCTIGKLVKPIGSIFWQPWHVGAQIWYDYDFTSYQTCTANFGEDPNCSDSIDLVAGSIEQHLHYFGLEVGGLCDSENVSGIQQSHENSEESEDSEEDNEEYEYLDQKVENIIMKDILLKPKVKRVMKKILQFKQVKKKMRVQKRTLKRMKNKGVKNKRMKN